MDYEGVIIEESLETAEILKQVKIIKTEVESVTERHQTPWLSKWTLHTIEVPEDKALEVAEEISRSLDLTHSWYADYKNDFRHYIIFRGKVFYIDRHNKAQYEGARQYGINLGIPEHQVDFSSFVKGSS